VLVLMAVVYVMVWCQWIIFSITNAPTIRKTPFQRKRRAYALLFPAGCQRMQRQAGACRKAYQVEKQRVKPVLLEKKALCQERQEADKYRCRDYFKKHHVAPATLAAKDY